MDVEVYAGDVEDLRELAYSWRDSADKSYGFDMQWDVFKLELQAMIEGKATDILVLNSKDGRPLGMMGIVKMPSPIGTGWFANEHYWYVEPSHRNGGGALAMIRRAERWAKENGCLRFMINASRLAGRHHDRLCRIYQRLGFEHFETSFIKEI
ncbi:MAG: GNAT family N-acetyltransferase [Planctomycetota bacterium]|jgi:RimJ/RimL family protein N-acetyltransferase